ncbi:hypothetical protein BN85404430 [Alteracholeplasma palmae J233]|uniref:Uncharacterized protein n=2 Tax=Acholeplasma palmae TaxID=38986 RepID=U4KP78_ALTPJ|nr:hypothetical protein BN85404430 [Alteracholeplasma palmae J233]
MVTVFTSTVSQKKEELINFVQNNLEEIKNSYLEEYGIYWNLLSLEKTIGLYDSGDKNIGFYFIFNEGYLSIGEDNILYGLSHKNHTLLKTDEKVYRINGGYYIKKNNQFSPNCVNSIKKDEVQGESYFASNIFKPLFDAKNDLKNFKITKSISNRLADSNNKKGKYTIFTDDQDLSDCGPQAANNLIQTYQLSGIKIAHSDKPRETLKDIRNNMNWGIDGRNYLGVNFEGVWAREFTAGIDKYLGSEYKIKTITDSSLEAPMVGLYYSLNIVNTSHFALIVGKAESKGFMFFKKRLDIVSSWRSTHEFGSNGNVTGAKIVTYNHYVVEEG